MPANSRRQAPVLNLCLRLPGLSGLLRCRWGAFAVALVLSLASAIPIVYLCRLPECGRRAAAAVAAGSLAVARLVSS
jgi:hypothetical protein